MDILLIIPPFIQCNSPYPSTTSLTGFLKKKGFRITQRDLSLDLLLKIFSRKGLEIIFNEAEKCSDRISDNSNFIIDNQEYYLSTIDNVIAFLQYKDQTLAHRISSRNFLPEASRFAQLNDSDEIFGTIGISDKARHLATLYLEDITDMIQECVDPDFGLSRYAESIALSNISFDSIEIKLQEKQSIIDSMMHEILEDYISECSPKIVGFSVPFPGNLYAALECGRILRDRYPKITRILGGGYANTELRMLQEQRVFKYTDYICLDDGERPLLHIAERIINKKDVSPIRTYELIDNTVKYHHGTHTEDFSHAEIGTPDCNGLKLDSYISLIEVANPMHRLWSEGIWNKMQIAHGCYWGKCSFCDTELDYIKRYSSASAKILCDRIEDMIAQTGQTGFHFTDEAAPPKILKKLAIELIERDINITWWTNVRFEKYFTYDICELLAASGCIAVAGGLEVASKRILKLINKGVDIEQVANAAHNFSQNGIMVHAYLMYGFPTQSDRDTIDALEIVRQLFENECIHSAFWHRFVMTEHSRVGKYPEEFKVKRKNNCINDFANNDLEHIDTIGCNHKKYGEGLKKALYNYMHGIGLDFPVYEWFDFKTVNTSITKNYIRNILR